ncbi:endogenous retrovirus group V member 2 Env polyprotein-like [Patagioenas fasciata]|uniref:endogenous retrovirus group V member 2 Env polyprotein-like n=1 Tax=Patagioenas fasciata TaxID=372321 RepID=UPI003A99E2ED
MATTCSLAPGWWWLCGDSRARKSLPDNWQGQCTGGYILPQAQLFNHSYPPPGIVRTLWKKTRSVSNNPLIQRPSGFHSFARWFLPWLGVSELEKAIVNISATIEKIENATVDALQGLQEEITSLSKTVQQNCMVLDLLTAKEGGVCVVINQGCCSYINQEKRVETDIQKIWKQSQILHRITLDETSWGFSELWEKLTSWLPNLASLCSLFAALVGILVLGILICIMMKCFLWCCQSTGDTYSNWKRHQLRQKLESNKYFEKELNRESY